MTLEELRTEAQKHGYKLTKEYPYISLAPCICGSKYRTMWFGVNNTYEYKCNKCGFASGRAKTKHDAKIKWNECVENARKEKDNV